MPAARWSLERLVDELELLGSRGLSREVYFEEVAGRLRRVFSFDAACWHTIDPETRLMTSDAPRELIEQGVFTAETAPAAGAVIAASEYLRHDVNTFAALARRRTPVGILRDATRGHPEHSARYREVLLPSGIPFELRAALVSRGRCWGAVHIARRDESSDFSAKARCPGRVVSTIADGVRATVRMDAARRPDDQSAPGLVVLGRSNDVELITAPARDLFAALRSPQLAQSAETPPTPVLALANHARGQETDGVRAVASPSSGGWLTLHASLPDGLASGRVAIVLERTASHRATAVRLEAHGVTPREREVAALLAQGLSNAEIAARLVLSPFTVQDHIKRLFEKTGVASRQELTARIFLDDYLPELVQRTDVAAGGGFVVALGTPADAASRTEEAP